MTAEIDELLATWHAELTGEIETTEVELREARVALAEAEIAERREKARWLAISNKVSIVLGRRPVPVALQQRLDAEEPAHRAAAGVVAQARGRAEGLDHRLTDLQDAAREIDQILTAPEIEPPAPIERLTSLRAVAAADVDVVMVFPDRRAS